MCYTKNDISRITESQRRFFSTGTTLDVGWRICQLKRLKAAIAGYEAELTEALAADLGRAAAESYLCDIGPTILEINETIRGLRRWARPERHFSGLLCFPSTLTKVFKMPYGVTLIVSPFNFPVVLTLGVLAASIAGGNTAVMKVSSKSEACSKVLKKLIADTFPEDYLTVIDGGHEVADLCLEERFDKIFYTGSPAIGRHILDKASVNLTPVALELGGETGNWCVVRKDADLKDAARKIAFIKVLNSGQICININQVAVAKEVADDFIRELKEAFSRLVGMDGHKNEEYPRLISDGAYARCKALADKYRDRIVWGGNGDPLSRRFDPTIIWPVDADEDIVRNELFNPLLPVVPFKDHEVARLLETIASREHPLAMYLFTRNIRWASKTLQSMQFGGGCINEVCVHMMVKGVPFNGTGHSGMGSYHGEWGFREFTHPQTVLYGRQRFNLSLREHPYTSLKLKLVRLFER